MSLNSQCVCVCLCRSGYELTGLARGGEQVSRLKRNYAKAVELLVELASLQVGGAVDNNSRLYCRPVRPASIVASVFVSVGEDNNRE